MSFNVDCKNIVNYVLMGSKFIHVDVNYKIFNSCHIKNSVYLNPCLFKTSAAYPNTIRGAEAILPEQIVADEVIGNIIRNLKISKNDILIVYGTAGSNLKNIFFTIHLLKSIGFLKVLYFNADYKNLPRELLTKDFSIWDSVHEPIRYFDDIISCQELSAYLKVNVITILDVRSENKFNGTDDTFLQAGHISTAKNIYWKNFFVQDQITHKPSNVLKSLEEINLLLDTVGLTKEHNLVITGENGNDIAPIVYILRCLCGWENIRCHFASWNVWSYLSDKNSSLFPISKK